SESLRVSMTQEGKPVLEAIVRTAAELPGLTHEHTEPPDVPGPEGLRSSDEVYAGQPTFPFWQNLEGRPVDPDLWREGRPARPPLLHQWYRYRLVATGGAQLLCVPGSGPAPRLIRQPSSTPRTGSARP